MKNPYPPAALRNVLRQTILLFRKSSINILVILALFGFSSCENQAVVDWVASLQAGGTPLPAPAGVTTVEFEVAEITFGDPAFILTPLQSGGSVDAYFVFLDITNPVAGSLLQIRELSGSRQGRVVLRLAGTGEGLTNNSRISFTVDNATNKISFQMTYGGNNYSGQMKLTNVMYIGRTLYVTTSISTGTGAPDADGDGIPDATDNCPSLANADQADADGDGIGDVCDCPAGYMTDGDGNCTIDINECANGTASCPAGKTCENLPGSYRCVCINDADGDGSCDEEDFAPNDATKYPGAPCGLNNECAASVYLANGDCSTTFRPYGSTCSTGTCDGMGNCSGSDADGDGIVDTSDNCPSTANADQLDSDGDGVGDVCDNCALVANHDQADANSDGVGDACAIQTPTVAATNIVTTDVFSDRLHINVTAGDGSGRLIVMRQGSAVNWAPVDGVEYEASGNFSQAIAQGDGNKVIQPDVTGLLPGITYYFKVFEFNGTGAQTKYLTTGAPVSSKKTLALPLVYVASPANNAINQKWNPTLTAREVTGATTYTIELSTSPEFGEGTIVQSGPRAQVFTELGFAVTYYTRVKTDLRPDYGKVTHFTTALPEYFSYVRVPSNGAVNQKVNLNISSYLVPDASEYTIQLSESADFSEVAFEVTGETNVLAFSGLKYSTTYYNRVRTNLSSPGNWGNTRTFTTRSAESISYVTSPANGSTGKNTALNITANLVPNATQYTIQLSETHDFAVVAFEMTGPTRTLAFSELKYNTTYYTRVKTDMSGSGGDCWTECTAASFACVANAGEDLDLIAQCEDDYNACITSCSDGWGEVRSFATRTAESISYVTSPANGAVDRNLSLNITANNVPGAIQYTIQLSESPDFSLIAFEATGSTRTLAFSGLKYNTTYYNRVRTDQSTIDNSCASECTDNYNACVQNAAEDPDAITICEGIHADCVAGCPPPIGGWGATRSFRTRTAESISYVTSPANNAVDRNTTLNISSNNVVGASEYTIQLSETEDFSVIAFEVTGPTRTLAFTGLNYNTTYYSRVKTNLSSIQVCFENCTAQSFVCVDGAADDPDAIALCEEAYNVCIASCTDIWGPTRNFKTRTAESISYVTSPADAAVDRNATLNISSSNVPGATEYTIQLSESPDFSMIAFEVTGATRTLAFSGLKYNTTYYNRVRTNLSSAADPDGWGIIRSFTTRTAESISYVTSPADAAIDRNTTLNISSNTVPGAGSYTIQLSEDNLFSVVAFEKTGSTRTLSFSGLKTGTVYYNRVTTDAPGANGFGQVRSFKTKGLAPPPAAVPAPSPAAPAEPAAPAGGRLASTAALEVPSETLAEFDVRVYPNPFREKLSLYIESRAEKQAGIKLMDLNGRSVHESIEQTNKTIEIDKSFAPGVYLLRVIGGSHQTVIRVVKSD